MELHHKRLLTGAACQRKALSKAGRRPLSPIPTVPLRVGHVQGARCAELHRQRRARGVSRATAECGVIGAAEAPANFVWKRAAGAGDRGGDSRGASRGDSRGVSRGDSRGANCIAAPEPRCEHQQQRGATHAARHESTLMIRSHVRGQLRGAQPEASTEHNPSEACFRTASLNVTLPVTPPKVRGCKRREHDVRLWLLIARRTIRGRERRPGPNCVLSAVTEGLAFYVCPRTFERSAHEVCHAF